jgi:hypothetical protein
MAFLGGVIPFLLEVAKEIVWDWLRNLRLLNKFRNFYQSIY